MAPLSTLLTVSLVSSAAAFAPAGVTRPSSKLYENFGFDFAEDQVENTPQIILGEANYKTWLNSVDPDNFMNQQVSCCRMARKLIRTPMARCTARERSDKLADTHFKLGGPEEEHKDGGREGEHLRHSNITDAQHASHELSAFSLGSVGGSNEPVCVATRHAALFRVRVSSSVRRGCESSLRREGDRAVVRDEVCICSCRAEP